MSSTEESSDLKGGHPPAVKAGGMRITQHKATHEKPSAPEPKKEDQPEDEEEEETPEIPPKPVPLVISGAVARGDSDFPASSVKAFHEKTPLPTNEFRQNTSKPNVGIHQPRK